MLKPANAPHKGNLYTRNNSTAMYIDKKCPGRTLTIPHVRNKQLYICHHTRLIAWDKAHLPGIALAYAGISLI